MDSKYHGYTDAADPPGANSAHAELQLDLSGDTTDIDKTTRPTTL